MKNKRGRIFFVGVATVAVLGLAACGPTDAGTNPRKAETGPNVLTKDSTANEKTVATPTPTPAATVPAR